MALSFNILSDDPTTQLCMVGNSFQDKKEKMFSPSVYSTPLIRLKDPVIKLIPSNSCPVSLVKGFDKLQELKDRLENIDQDIIKRYNPYENIGNSIFMSRAAIKLANIDAVFRLTASWGDNLLTEQHAMYFGDLAGGPGAFTQYLLWRVSNSAAYGITLSSENNKLSWNKKLMEDLRFHPVFGPDGTGNLYDIENHRDFYEKMKETAGAHIVVSDGGFETKGKQCSRREFMTSRLITAECFLGVSVLRKHGHFVCKLYDTVTKYMQQLLYLMSLLFEEISVFKPISSRPINAERYLVCKGFRKDEYIIGILDEVFNSYSDEKYVESFLADKIPNDFIQWWLAQNKLSIDRQWYYTDRLLRQLENSQIEPIKFNGHKALILWNLPGNIDRLRISHIRRRVDATAQQSLLNMDYNARSPYSYTNVEEFMRSEHSKEYPYKRIYYTNEDIVNMFKTLRYYEQDPMYYLKSKDNFKLSNLNMDARYLRYSGAENVGRQKVMITKDEEYYYFNILSDIFNEEARLKAIVIGQNKNPYECYFDNLEKIATDALKKEGHITPHSLREAAFTSTMENRKICKEVTSFRPNVLTHIIKMFRPKSMLDFSAGWGDRLIAAMAADISYTGVDPNGALHKGYNQIIDFFYQIPELHIDKTKYAMINAPFEFLKVKDLPKVDLVMTSPPYFDLEKYSPDETQSISKYKSEEAWTNRFLIPALNMSIDRLNESGYLVININQRSRDQKYISKMLDAVSKNMEYLGVFFYARKRGNHPNITFENPQPIWVWRKGPAKIHIVPITSSMSYEIKNMVLDAETMRRHSNDGTIWNIKKLNSFLTSQDNIDCNRYYRAALIDGKVEGLIMFDSIDNEYYLTKIFNRELRNKDYENMAIEMAIKDFADVRINIKHVYYESFPGKKMLSIGYNLVKEESGDIERYRIDLPNDRPYTFTTAFEYLSDRVYKERLTEKGWKYLTVPETISSCYVDLLALADKYEWDNNFYDITAELKQNAKMEVLTNKVRLHNLLEGEKYIAETMEVVKDTKFPEEGVVWIWRPEGEYSGRGIHLLSTQSQLDTLKAKQGDTRVILSRYMTNPLLLSDGRKFHLRIFLVIIVSDNNFRAIVFNNGRLGVAKKKFILDDWESHDIHITHMTSDYLRYPRDFPRPKMVNSVNKQIDIILRDVMTKSYTSAEKYEEASVAYKLLGCDFLVDDRGKVSLVEINYKPGFKMMDKDTNEWISDTLANGIIDDVILPYFENSKSAYKHTREVIDVNL